MFTIVETLVIGLREAEDNDPDLWKRIEARMIDIGADEHLIKTLGWGKLATRWLELEVEFRKDNPESILWGIE